jgi:hypothetical protein
MTVPPGSTIGIIGGGQLGRMLGVAAARLGYKCRILDPNQDSPAAHVAAGFICAAYDDVDALSQFESGVDVATYEFENLPVGPLKGLGAKLRPGTRSLAIAQDRALEKEFIEQCGGRVALITNLAQVSIAVFLLESSVPQQGKQPSIVQSIGRSATNPLVWAPVLGGVLAVLGLQLSPYVAATLEPLAAAASGVAIFASGLVLAAHRLKFSPLVLLGSLVVLALQPAVFFLAMKIGGLSGLMPSATMVASAFPNATIAILFSQQYKTAEPEIASVMLITTIGMIVAIPLTMIASGYL